LVSAEKSRLPVVLPARELRMMMPRFQQALDYVLHDLSASEQALAAERRSMEEIAIARTIDRHVLGSILLGIGGAARN
jgi:hypothetical protein